MTEDRIKELASKAIQDYYGHPPNDADFEIADDPIDGGMGMCIMDAIRTAVAEATAAELFAAALKATLPVVNVSYGWTTIQTGSLCSYHNTKDGVVVRVVWPSPPTGQQMADANAVVLAGDLSPAVANIGE